VARLSPGIMRAIDVARQITGADKVNALGFCVGGTMLGCAASVMAARNEDKIESL
jgi:polyhydroxyalkanoate synthase subunit PhaC